MKSHAGNQLQNRRDHQTSCPKCRMGWGKVKVQEIYKVLRSKKCGKSTIVRGIHSPATNEEAQNHCWNIQETSQNPYWEYHQKVSITVLFNGGGGRKTEKIVKFIEAQEAQLLNRTKSGRLLVAFDVGAAEIIEALSNIPKLMARWIKVFHKERSHIQGQMASHKDNLVKAYKVNGF